MYYWRYVNMLVCLLSSISIAAAGETSPQRFKVGIILPFSGDLVSLGHETRRGMQLALEDFSEPKAPIELIFEDDQSLDTRVSVDAAQKLLNVDRVDLGLTLWVEESKHIASLFNSQKVPLIVLWDSNKSISESGDFVFSNGFSSEDAGADMAAFAVRHLKVQKVAVLRHEDSWAKIISQSFSQRFQALGGSVVYANSVPLDLRDFRTSIAEMQRADAEALYFPLLPPALLSFIKQVRELEIETHLLTGDAFIQDIVRQGGAASEGIYLTNVYYPNTSQLLLRYRRKFGSAPADLPIVACGYDGMKRVLEATKLAQKGTSLHQALLEVLGSKRTAHRREAIFRVENGKRSLVSAPRQEKH